MTSPLVERREQIAATQRAACRAVSDLWPDRSGDALYHALVADLIRNAPEAVIAACGRLGTPISQTHTTSTEQP